MLIAESRSKIVASIKSLVLKHHIGVVPTDYDAWLRLVDGRTPKLLNADLEGFEAGVRDLLSALGGSHTSFFHDIPSAFPPQHTINATLSRRTWNGSDYWTFLDVFEEGPAHSAGIKRGDKLVAVDRVACTLASMPRFKIGHLHKLAVSTIDGRNDHEIPIDVPTRKGSKRRPPIVEPKALTHRKIPPDVGLMRITYFPGAFGIGFSRDLDAAVQDLRRQGCLRLVVDLRGNIGGSLGFARLASYMCPGRIPIGYSLTPTRSRTDYDPRDLPRVPMPATRTELALALARFAFRDKSVMLLTQGLGAQPFHGRTVLLVNEWTNSAAEMAASFAAENHLATIIGTKTAGNVLGATNFKVGSGYWLRIPIFGWYTPNGQSLDGTGVHPDVPIELTADALASGEDNQLMAATEAVHSL